MEKVMDVYSLPNGRHLLYAEDHGGHGFYAVQAHYPVMYSDIMDYVGTFIGELDEATRIFSWVDDDGVEHKAHA